MEIAVAPLRPETAMGVDELVVVPLPNWPSPLNPQHSTVPPESSAQADSPPAEIAVTPLRPETATGVEESVVVPLPSSPWPLLPQHSTVPPDRSAQAETEPSTETAVAPLRPETATGVEESVV